MKIDLTASLQRKRASQSRPASRAGSAPAGLFAQTLQTKLGKGADTTPAAGVTQEKVVEYTVKPGDTLWKIGVRKFQVDPAVIAKENGLSRPDLIHPGQKLRIPIQKDRSPQVVTASWYGAEYHNRPTASGERFDMFQNTVAHKTLPMGTQVRLANPDNGRTAVARVNDRGPFIDGREIDLSYAVASQLGMVEKGVGKLVMEII
jgi:rare lipoprotein A